MVEFFRQLFLTLGDFIFDLPGAVFVLIIAAGFVVALWYLRNWLDGFRAARADAKSFGRPAGVSLCARLLLNTAVWRFGTFEIFERQNWSYTTMRASTIFAQAYAMTTVIGTFNPDRYVSSTGYLLAHSVWIIVALLVTTFIVDLVVLPRVNNVTLMMQGNLAVGIVEAACFVGAGMILRGTLTSNPDSWKLTIGFYFIGLAFVMAVFLLHERIAATNTRQGIKENRLSAAIGTASLIVVASRIAEIGVSGELSSWGGGIATCLVIVLFGIALFYGFRWFFGWAIMRECTIANIQQNNLVAASVVSAVLVICFSQIIVSAVTTLL